MSLSMPNANTTTSVTMPPDREALSLMANLKLDRFKLGKQKFDEEYAEIMKKNNDATLSLLDKVQMLKYSRTSQTLLNLLMLDLADWNWPTQGVRGILSTKYR
ncbi:unnamed protein product [Rotaria socialis]|uniref:Uncharacterized protein n=1 Tax=Rotaria socialis TaxID=392032 RepID=A0A817XAW5_9BILA|nr:unnamed protein product [Rotaria socialis]